jgi:3-hydroxyisobutyrate dehydrogenase
VTAPLGMIGLGRTGLPIAVNLLGRGHAVVGYRRSDASALVAAGGQLAPSPRALGEAARVIFSVLPSPAALEEVMSGERGLLGALGRGHVVVELSSYPLPVKERYRDLVAARGAVLLDGEISGTPAMTAARKSVFLVAGARADADRVLPLLADATEHALYAGPFGAATKLKLVANLLVAVHTAAAAEALLLVERAGLDPLLATQVLGLGAASSTMLTARAASMTARRFVDPAPGPVAMLAHYLEPIATLAATSASPTPLFTTAAELFRRALAEGRAQQDIGCVIELLDGAEPKKGGSS